jgi:ribonuclease VapC
MIVDTSALAAILLSERDAVAFAQAIEAADRLLISAATYLEAGIVLDRKRNPALSRRLDDFLVEAGITVEPVTERQARIAREAYRDFGKGSGHPAQLNFGDCFAYALAKDVAEPLLFKGSDFAHTDVRPAVP